MSSVNCWKYAREVYLLGRSLKYRAFTAKEREAVIAFIIAIKETRPAYVDYINLKKDNSYDTTQNYQFQNDYALGKMVQKIGRSLKIQFCTEEEKALCDALFAATDFRKDMKYNGYVTDIEESSSAEEPAEESSSESEIQESSSPRE